MRSEITKKDNGTFSGFDEEKSGVPPLRKTPNGRANTAGIPVLYTATERDTACAEIRPMKNDYISVAEYKVKEDIIVANFTLEQISKFDNIEAMFLEEMFRSFSLPVSNDLIDYLLSQFIVEYIKLKHKNIARIRYSSLHNIGGYNVAIFNKNECDFIKSDVIECSKVTYEYENI